MDMTLRQKFLTLTILVGILLAIVSIVGYNNAYDNLATSVEGELMASVESQGNSINGWLKEKGSSVEHEANLLSEMKGDQARIKQISNLAIISSDPEIIELTMGLEDGYFAGYKAGEVTGTKDPRQRPWYQSAKAKGGLIFTDAYIDTFTNQLIISAGAPIKSNGQFIGAVCNDITLTVLEEQAKNLNYHGEGRSLIFDKNGVVLATTGDAAIQSNVKDIQGVGEHLSEMLSNGKGFFEMEGKFGDSVFAYVTVPATGWIVGLDVPTDFVFAPAHKLRWIFGGLTLFGLILTFVVCGKTAASILSPISALEIHANELAKGNLRQENLEVRSSDEIGNLTTAFNEMSKSLRNLITKMATTAEQVAASSEELTASAQQSAEAAVNVAETVAQVGGDITQQMQDIEAARGSIDVVSSDIKIVSDKALNVATTSEKTAAAAKTGEELMQEAASKMNSIEKSVLAAAEVVEKLGESSKQIGQIVEAISGIADQTNL
ncbi:MAG: methyl-accepting chemotaxis protein, partial [Selenomonadaceae bacterium]|nr:methyl-accepting chemotaxis protein [Selenomonadaceae bacterium]